jgi:hypothetical protein
MLGKIVTNMTHSKQEIADQAEQIMTESISHFNIEDLIPKITKMLCGNELLRVKG